MTTIDEHLDFDPGLGVAKTIGVYDPNDHGAVTCNGTFSHVSTDGCVWTCEDGSSHVESVVTVICVVWGEDAGDALVANSAFEDPCGSDCSDVCCCAAEVTIVEGSVAIASY